MSQRHGRRYEHQLVNSLDEITPPTVWVTSAGYSGNAVADDCDIVVTIDPGFAMRHDTMQFNIEAKKRRGESGKRVSNAISGSSSDESGVEELHRLVDATPSWAEPIVALKLDHRKLVVFHANWLLAAVGEDTLSSPRLIDDDLIDTFEPRLTPSENVSICKPETDEFPSAQASESDEIVLAESLGLPYNGSEN